MRPFDAAVIAALGASLVMLAPQPEPRLPLVHPANFRVGSGADNHGGRA